MKERRTKDNKNQGLGVGRGHWQAVGGMAKCLDQAGEGERPSTEAHAALHALECQHAT